MATSSNSTQVQELGNLPIGTIIKYTDTANPNTKYVVLDEMKSTRWGVFTYVMNLKTHTIEPKHSDLKITGNWSIFQEAIKD